MSSSRNIMLPAYSIHYKEYGLRNISKILSYVFQAHGIVRCKLHLGARWSDKLGTDYVAILSRTLFTSCSNRDTRCCSCLLAGAPSLVLLLCLLCPPVWLVRRSLNFSCQRNMYRKTHPFTPRKSLVLLRPKVTSPTGISN